MNFAPVAVFAAVSGIIARSDLGVLRTCSVFMGEFYFAIVLLWIVLSALGFVFLGPRIIRLLAELREPTLLTFSTASSEAALGKRWRASSVSAYATASPPSCRRSATRSISTAR
jgi:Na+/H+-dicarboxylate symporter